MRKSFLNSFTSSSDNQAISIFHILFLLMEFIVGFVDGVSGLRGQVIFFDEPLPFEEQDIGDVCEDIVVVF